METVLTRRDARTLVRLLGVLQTYLESAIETNTVDGRAMPGDAYTEGLLRMDRRDWRLAEDMVLKLSLFLSKLGISCTLRLMAKSPASKSTKSTTKTPAAVPVSKSKKSTPVATMPAPKVTKAIGKKKATKTTTAAA